MLSERNAVHPVAQMYAVQPERFEHDGPKTSNQHSDETHPYSHCQCHDPEARLARWKLSKDAARENISREHIQKNKAEDYHCVRNRILAPDWDRLSSSLQTQFGLTGWSPGRAHPVSVTVTIRRSSRFILGLDVH
jgi:hypothetical protein